MKLCLLSANYLDEKSSHPRDSATDALPTHLLCRNCNRPVSFPGCRVALEAKEQRARALQRRAAQAATAARDEGERAQGGAANMQRLDALRQARQG